MLGGNTEGRENNKSEELQGDKLNGNDDCTVLRITTGHDEKEGGVTGKGKGKLKEAGSEPGILREMDPNIERQTGMLVEKKDEWIIETES